MSKHPILLLVLVLALGLAACGDETPALDRDAGQQADAGEVGESDAGDDPSDAGNDAGEDPDDAGEELTDCGGRAGATCEDGEYCQFTLEAQCGAFDQTGVCTPIPEPICPPVVMPVCGCDGVTYSSACDAAAAGVSVAAEGACAKDECKAQDVEPPSPDASRSQSLGYYWDGATCVELTGESCTGADCGALFDSRLECLDHYRTLGCYEPPSCGGRDGGECAADEFCDYDDGDLCGAFDATGVCWPRPDPRWCDVMNEQCGCDGETYANACRANAAGTDVLYPGPCVDDIECRAQQATGDNTNATSLGFAFNGHDCIEQFGECEGPDCDALFDSRATCRTRYLDLGCIEATSCGGHGGSACEDGDYCYYPVEALCGASDMPGTCTPIPHTICPPLVKPVCGCDGVTYSSACDAEVAGVSVAAAGACVKPGCEAQDVTPLELIDEGRPAPSAGYFWDGATCLEFAGSSCAGEDCDAMFGSKAACLDHYVNLGCYEPALCGVRGGSKCAEDEFCDFRDGAACGAIDLGGRCWPRPDPRWCDLMNEQCGCDGQTYANACYANAAGTDVSYPGPCVDNVECRAQQATGDNSSATSLGFAFNGYGCAELLGECEGADCEALFPTFAECFDHYQAEGCVERAACNDAMSSCSPYEYCDYADANACGLTDGDGVCMPRPILCTRDLAPVCGCNGTTYSNECEAARAGVDFGAPGSCECQPQDAAPVGLCKMVIGYYWAGDACAAMEGCSCAGADCVGEGDEAKAPFESLEACREAFEKEAGCVSHRVCGGGHGDCEVDEYCDYAEDGDCGYTDGTGVCTRRPVKCLAEDSPVCGCDGGSYGNECQAAKAGVDVRNVGHCTY